MKEKQGEMLTTEARNILPSSKKSARKIQYNGYIPLTTIMAGKTSSTKFTLCLETTVVSAGTQVSLLREHGGHILGQLFSLFLVETKDGWSIFSLSTAG